MQLQSGEFLACALQAHSVAGVRLVDSLPDRPQVSYSLIGSVNLGRHEYAIWIRVRFAPNRRREAITVSFSDPAGNFKTEAVKNAEFESIFEANKDAIFGFAWRMTGTPDVAEDIAQDCFLSLLKAPGSFDSSRGNVRAWLLGVARNLLLKRWRAEGRWVSLENDELMSSEPPPADWNAVRRVAHAVQALPPLQREVVLLIEYEGMTLQEAANAVEAEVGTVKARLHRARENLRCLLEPLRGNSRD